MASSVTQTTCLKAILVLAVLSGLAVLPISGASDARTWLPDSKTTQDGAQNDTTIQGVVSTADSIQTVELAIDDGSFENAIGLTLGGTLFAANRLTPPSYPATLTEVRIFFRREQFGGNVSSFDPIVVLAGPHPDGSDNIQLTQFQTLDSTVQALGQFSVHDVPDVTINSGDFIVGFRMTHIRNQFPIALDSTAPFIHRSYVSTNGTTFIHIEDAGLVLIGNFGIRAKVNLLLTCAYTIAPTSQSFGTAGGNGSVNVTTTQSDCAWTATTGASWITITGGSGTGNGVANFTVAPNPGVGRTANINIAGQPFTVTQAGLPLPTILGASIVGKKLLVSGENFDDGAAILINGSVAKKVFNDVDLPRTLLIAKKAGKAIAPGQMVTLQVRNASGVLSAEFNFVRP
jgi:hypothetical protein